MDSEINEMKMVIVANRLPFVLKPVDVHTSDEEDAKSSISSSSSTSSLSSPITTYQRHPSAGGLVTALAPVVKEHGGIWVGWPGVYLTEGEKVPDGDETSENSVQTFPGKQVRVVNIEPVVFDGYYSGCSNTALWPLCHSMPDRAKFRRDDYAAYEKVNRQFASVTYDATCETYDSQMASADGPRGETLVWIHDYQLMLVPAMVRQMLDESGTRRHCRLAFFLHIPFPPWDVFRLFPWDEAILLGLLGCDLIGFHVDIYADNFIECCQRRLGARVDRQHRRVLHEGRTVVARAFPIGVPFKQFETAATAAVDVDTVDPSLRLVLGVDRLDYTKGIIHRVLAFERLLDAYPEHIERVILLQVAVPSRTDVCAYKELKAELEREVGRINGRFSTTRWSPIRYIYRSMAQSELCAYYRDAAVALVTPIRDGMNLVAKEFVACQIKEPGVLILSPFTGAGETMHEALLVNPLEEHGLADTIHRALTMPLDERELRMSALRHRERKYDVHNWVKAFLRATSAFSRDLSTPVINGGSVDISSKLGPYEPLTVQHFEQWLAKYVDESKKLVLMLDYDGTLAPIARHPDDARLPNDTRTILERLTTMPDVFVSIISGRSIKSVKAMVGIEHITYAGNHGLDIEHPDGTTFIHPDQAKFAALIADLKDELDREVCRDGAWVENKGVGLTFHYRAVCRQEARQALVDQATALILRHGFRPCKAHCAIEARPPISWDKGRASIHVLRTTFGVDWSERARVVYVGDDATDEDAMQALSGMAVSFRVTNAASVLTAANHRLTSTRCVYTLLQWVEQHFARRARKNSGGDGMREDVGGRRVFHRSTSYTDARYA